MTAKIQKLREELAKDNEKLERLQARIEQRTKKLNELEATEIVGMVRATGLTLDQLALLIPKMKENPIPKPEQLEQEVSESETE